MMFADFRPFAFSGLATVCAFGALIATTAVVPAMADSPSHCARYGSDYVAVAGSSGCVRIAGHVRADIARAPAAPMNYAAMQDGVQHASAHASSLQPVAPFGLSDLFPR